jgi:asparaginyl-tRNA synthetase
MLIKEILCEKAAGQGVTVSGWVRTKRTSKRISFLEINDGSVFKSIQCTFDRDLDGGSSDAELEKTLSQISTGCAVEVRGTLVPSPAAGQEVEVQGSEITLIGEAPAESYPLQKKGHSLEFLRELAHLRARTNTIGAVARVRSRLAFAVHAFFQARGFQYVHTPIITAQDAEGAGALFQVTTLDIEALAKAGKGAVDWTQDFFGKKTFLTVSGQLEGETYAAALSRIYTFGPTFRAENSNTARHLAEFWMIEPEIAFAHLEDNMALAEDFLKYLISDYLENCRYDAEFFDSRIQKGLINTLKDVLSAKFSHITYTDAVKELEKHNDGFEFKVFWGCDLQSEHEKFLTENVAGGPVILTDYPKEIKAFYMKANDDGKTVRAMDVLFPRLGEIIGGSEREDNFAKLLARMRELKVNPDAYSWYLDLRRYGSVPHAGFGLGFERLVQYVTGMANIRDVIPYPRTAGYAGG